MHHPQVIRSGVPPYECRVVERVDVYRVSGREEGGDVTDVGADGQPTTDLNIKNEKWCLRTAVALTTTGRAANKPQP